jgi:hypothetical protein
MADIARHHARILGSLAAEWFPDAEVSFDPGRLHEMVKAPVGGLVTVEVDSLELEDDDRLLVGLSLTLTRESLDAEAGLWALTADCSALWSLLRRAAGHGVPYSYDGGAVSGHTGVEWLELVNLESYFWRSGVEAPPRPALRHAVTSLRLAVVSPN